MGRLDLAGRSTRAAAALTLLAALVVVLLIGGCAGDGGASAASPSAGPAAFADESYAELASDGQDGLWMAVAGYTTTGKFGLRVFEKDGAGWAELPVPPGQVSSDVAISFVDPESAEAPGPCLGYSLSPSLKPVVICFSQGMWQPEDLPTLGAGSLLEIGSDDGELLALAGELRGRSGRFYLLREQAGQWAKTPPVVAPAAIARLAIQPDGSSSSPAFGLVTQGASSQHSVFELRGKTWKKLRPTVTDVAPGPLVGGPVVFGDRVLYPVNEADPEPWSFSVQTARIGSTDARSVRLSTGAGNAQGRLDLVGNTVWATWQEHRPRPDGSFLATVYAAALTPSGKVRRKVALWRGVSIGPGSTQVIEYQGEPLALYMRGSRSGRGLQVALKPLG